MKILYVNYQRITGVEYYRAIKPHSILDGIEFTSIPAIHPTDDLKTGNKDEYEKNTDYKLENLGVTYNNKVSEINDDFLKSFDLIVFIREISCPIIKEINGVRTLVGFYKPEEIVKRLNRLGVKFGLDLDDYWHLPEKHILYDEYVKHDRSKMTIDSIKLSHFVTCTTPILAKEIEQYNKNVYVIENGLDSLDKYWQPEHTSSPYLRFGLMVGSTHYHDIKKIAPQLKNVLRNEKKAQIVLAGFNAFTQEINKKKYHSSYHIMFEKEITDNHNPYIISPEYRRFLLTCSENGNELYAMQRYYRLWSKPIDEFPRTYKHIDISVAPLIDNKFNNCKSELKMIEAGFKGKGVIVSNVYPFKLLATEQNAYICNSSAEFYDKMKRAINNPNEVADKIAQLRQDVLERYDLRKINEKRKELYESNRA